MIVFSVSKNDDSNLEKLKFKVDRLYRLCTLIVVVLDPIQTTGLNSPDVDRIAAETRDKMLNVLEKISHRTNPQPPNGATEFKKEL